MNASDALLIVDVQNDFCPGGALAVPWGDRIIPMINRISGHFSTVAATMDWHPKGHVSFASSHAGKRPGDSIETGGIAQYLWPDHCVMNSIGAEFHPLLDTGPVSIILRKGMSISLDSYSAFAENNRASATGLEGYFLSRGVTAVYVCGLATDYCVYYSLMDAVARGFSAVLVEDCAAGVNLPEGNLEKTLAAMKRSGIRFTDSGAL